MRPFLPSGNVSHLQIYQFANDVVLRARAAAHVGGVQSLDGGIGSAGNGRWQKAANRRGCKSQGQQGGSGCGIGIVGKIRRCWRVVRVIAATITPARRCVGWGAWGGCDGRDGLAIANAIHDG